MALVLGLCWVGAAVGRDRSDEKTVEAERFVSRDNEGRLRAQLGLAEDDIPVLQLYDERGVVIFSHEDVVSLWEEIQALGETVNLMGAVPVTGAEAILTFTSSGTSWPWSASSGSRMRLPRLYSVDRWPRPG